MTLLRASSEAIGENATLDATVGRGGSGGLPHGEEIVRFGEAVSKGEDAGGARDALIEAVGPAGFVEAAGIVGIFNGLVRTADASGIPLDDGTRDASGEFREALGLESYAGASNTDLRPTSGDHKTETLEKLFR
ncbi:MAG: hypothetical protein P8R42_09505 [Candidatus Binatia bacterium]|nr:hypothetical protein [Candidatus Binatia bacterium]